MTCEEYRNKVKSIEHSPIRDFCRTCLKNPKEGHKWSTGKLSLFGGKKLRKQAKYQIARLREELRRAHKESDSGVDPDFDDANERNVDARIASNELLVRRRSKKYF